MSTLQHEAHGSDVEEEKRRRVVNKNFKAMRMANAEKKRKYQKVSVESMCISEASLHFRRPAPTWSMRRGSHRQSKSKDTG